MAEGGSGENYEDKPRESRACGRLYLAGFGRGFLDWLLISMGCN
jgi:hypothetical protein